MPTRRRSGRAAAGGTRTDDEEDRPRRKRRRRSYDPHRGTTIILCAVFGLCCGFLAIAAVIMGFMDLAKMNRGEMDPDGKTPTIIGLVIGFLVVGLNIVAGRDPGGHEVTAGASEPEARAREDVAPVAVSSLARASGSEAAHFLIELCGTAGGPPC